MRRWMRVLIVAGLAVCGSVDRRRSSPTTASLGSMSSCAARRMCGSAPRPTTTASRPPCAWRCRPSRQLRRAGPFAWHHARPRLRRGRAPGPGGRRPRSTASCSPASIRRISRSRSRPGRAATAMPWTGCSTWGPCSSSTAAISPATGPRPRRSSARASSPDLPTTTPGTARSSPRPRSLAFAISPSSDWREAFHGADHAMVSYPLLIGADGQSRSKGDARWLANRSFVGQDGAGRIVLGTTKDAFFSLDRLAAFLRAAPLDLKLALNLDGGPIACQAIALKDFRRDFCGGVGDGDRKGRVEGSSSRCSASAAGPCRSCSRWCRGSAPPSEARRISVSPIGFRSRPSGSQVSRRLAHQRYGRASPGFASRARTSKNPDRS